MKFRVWIKQTREYLHEDFILTSSGKVYYIEYDKELTDDVEIDFSIGLQDINGREIYMNDIVQISSMDVTITVDHTSISLLRSLSKPESIHHITVIKTIRD